MAGEKTVQSPSVPDNLAMLQQVMAARTPMQPDPTPTMTGMLPGMGQPAAAPATPGPMGPTNPFDMASNIHSVMQVPEVQAMLSNLGNIQQQMGNEQMRARALATPEGQVVPGTGQNGEPGLAGAMPKMQFSPDMHGSLMHKIGQALLSVAASTRPGQAIQDQVYGRARQQWGAQRESNVQALSDLKAQLGVPTEELKSVSGLGQGMMMGAYRSGALDVQNRRADIAQQKADQQGQQIAQQYAVSLQKLQQGSQRLSLEQQGLQLRSWFEKGLLESYNARIAAGQENNEARIGAQQDMNLAKSQNQWALQHPIWNALGMSPTITGAPGASTATAPTPAPAHQPTAKPKKPAGGSTKIIVRPEDMK